MLFSKIHFALIAVASSVPMILAAPLDGSVSIADVTIVDQGITNIRDNFENLKRREFTIVDHGISAIPADFDSGGNATDNDLVKRG
jgi:hypothetical protein